MAPHTAVVRIQNAEEATISITTPPDYAHDRTSISRMYVWERLNNKSFPFNFIARRQNRIPNLNDRILNFNCQTFVTIVTMWGLK